MKFTWPIGEEISFNYRTIQKNIQIITTANYKSHNWLCLGIILFLLASGVTHYTLLAVFCRCYK